MLEDQDLQKIQGIVQHEIGSAEKQIVDSTDLKLQAAEKRIVDSTDLKLQAAEKRIVDNVTENVTARVTSSIVEQVGEMLEQNVLPAIDAVADGVQKLSVKITNIPDDVERLLNKRFGETVARDKRLDEKINTLGNALVSKGTLTHAEIAKMQQIDIFRVHTG